MSLRELPDPFLCATCHARLPLESLCVDASSAVILRCVGCCGCLAHTGGLDPGGTVVLDFRARHPWRGLDGSPHRTRRHR